MQKKDPKRFEMEKIIKNYIMFMLHYELSNIVQK